MTREEIDALEPLRGVSPEEAECTIVIDRLGDAANIYVSDNTYLTKILRKWRSAPDEYRLLETFRDKNGNVTGYSISTQKSNISFRAGKIKRSEESRQSASKRTKEWWASKPKEDAN